MALALCVSGIAFAGQAEPAPENLVKGKQFIPDDGATLYHAICQGCHMPDAKGAQGAGSYPALADNPKLASAAYPAVMVLHGRNAMPSFGAALSDTQVAAVVNYVRTHFGNNYSDKLTAADVAKFR
ncbi:cytochrome c [Rhodanobacter sp. Si-c]|uniref:Cytochrome c n=1 Tax=Rhodanobacter lycopersici TaxID=3162487 RepID=A0ABV3QGL3_9GAMM